MGTLFAWNMVILGALALVMGALAKPDERFLTIQIWFYSGFGVCGTGWTVALYWSAMMAGGS